MCLQLPIDLAEMAFLCSTFLRFYNNSLQNLQIKIYKNIRFDVQLVGNVDLYFFKSLKLSFRKGTFVELTIFETVLYFAVRISKYSNNWNV